MERRTGAEAAGWPAGGGEVAERGGVERGALRRDGSPERWEWAECWAGWQTEGWPGEPGARARPWWDGRAGRAEQGEGAATRAGAAAAGGCRRTTRDPRGQARRRTPSRGRWARSRCPARRRAPGRSCAEEAALRAAAAGSPRVRTWPPWAAERGGYADPGCTLLPTPANPVGEASPTTTLPQFPA